jgi:zinc transport system substrate-binding protein
VRGDGVAAPVRHSLDRRLERRVLERLHLAAVVADEVVVMVTAGVRGLEPRDTVAELDALDEAQGIQPVEGAVDARDPDAASACPHALVDLESGQAALLLADELDDETPCRSAPAARVAQAGERLRCPRGGHADNDTRSQLRATVARVRALPILAVALLVAGCGSTSGSDRRPTVVAGFYPLAWAAQRIGGPGVRVVNLTPAGAEPHDLELTPSDIEAIDGAQLVLYLGHGFQPAVEKAAEARSGPSLDLLAGQRLAAVAGDEEGGGVDPHVWLDPARFARIAVAIGAALHRERAADALVARLHRLDAEFRSGLRDCERHEFVTSHAAFGYLATRYGLRQVALTGLSPEAEPSPRDLEALVDEVRKSGATTVFFETLVSPRLAQTVAREAGAKTAVLDPVEGLSDDEVAAGDDYVTVMRRNLSTLRRALACR